MNQPIVAIPAYKEKLSEYEKVSFFQCCKILKEHKFSLICPEGLNLEMYEKIFDEYGVKYQAESFPKEYFTGIEKYNELMLSADFYKRFIDYSFMLVYQLDAYVFDDKLNYWCEQDYDYIGAPWFEGFDSGDDNAKMLNAGNGGLSLRKIDSFIKVLKDKDRVNKFIEEQVKNNVNEDIFFSIHAQEIAKEFKVAPSDVAMHFSFECQPRKLYKMTRNKLPFGCHAWERFDLDFWIEFIDLSEVDFGREDKINKEEISKLKSKLTYLNVLRGKLKGEQERSDSIYEKLNKKESQLLALQKEFEKKEKQLIAVKNQLRVKKEGLKNKKMELEDIRSSFEWKVILILKKFLTILIPSKKIRSKVGTVLRSRK